MILFRRKVYPKEFKSDLKKCLGIFSLLLISISGTIGSGAYSLLGPIAVIGGPASVLSCVFTGIVCFLTCLPYCEFSATNPAAGSAYSFIYESMGELPANTAGHTLTLFFAVSGAAIARAWASYVNASLTIIGIHLPQFLTKIEIFPGNSDIYICPLATLAVLIFTFTMFLGAQESTRISNIICFINMSTLLSSIIVGFFYIDFSHFSNFFEKGFSNILNASSVAFFVFIGLDNVACFIEEALNPKRDIPASLISSLSIASVINIGIISIMIGMLNLNDYVNKNPTLIDAFIKHDITVMQYIIAVGSIIGLSASVATNLMGQPRIFYVMATDKLIPQKFKEVVGKNKIPLFAIIATGIIGILVATFFDLGVTANTISLGTLFNYAFVDLGLIVKRYEEKTTGYLFYLLIGAYFFISLSLGFSLYLQFPYYFSLLFTLLLLLIVFYIFFYYKQHNFAEGFQCPFVPFVPFLGATTSLILCGSMQKLPWLFYLIYQGAMLLVYLFYGVWHSNLNPKRNDSLPLIEADENKHF